MNWISCKKRLPSTGQEVLAYVIYQSGLGDFTLSCQDMDGLWEMGSAKGFKVTHWMPLRKPRSK